MRQCSFSVFLFQLTLSARKDWGTLTHLRSLSRKGWACPRLQISQGKTGPAVQKMIGNGMHVACVGQAVGIGVLVRSGLIWAHVWSLDQCKMGPTELRSLDLCRRKHKENQSLGIGQILKSSDSDQSHVQCACLIIRVTFWCHRFEVLWSAPACGLIPRFKNQVFTLKIQLLFIRIKIFQTNESQNQSRLKQKIWLLIFVKEINQSSCGPRAGTKKNLSGWGTQCKANEIEAKS